MAPIPIKRVVSVSSEDESNPATNLLQGRKWLTRLEEKARRAEVVVELSKRARINSLELGNFGSAFIEVHVSAAASESSTTEWLTLLPSCMLMTVPDSRAGRNKTSSLVCSRERFSATTAGLKWSFLKIICRQPYNLTSQFGLQHVAFYSDTPSTPATPSPSPSLRSHPSPSPQTPKDTPDYANRHRLPSLPSSATPCKPGDPNSSRTPHRKGNFKQPLGDSNTSEEFSGLERQSRLLRNALKGPREPSDKMNPILERAVEEEGKKKEKKFEELYQKRKLLVAELSKAQGKSDFTDGYGKTPSSVEMTAAFRKISRHDNKCEIGQEEDRWSWGGSRKRGKRRRGRRGGGGEGEGEDAWISKRKKKLSGMIKECRRVLSQAGTAGGTSGRAEDLSTANDETETSPLKSNQPQTKEDPAAADSDSDSDATVIIDDPQPPVVSLPPLLPLQLSPETPTSAIPCPLCGESFPSYAIELHAANCGDSHPDNTLPLPIISID